MFRLVHQQIQTLPWTTKARGGLSSTTRANAPSVTRGVRLSVAATRRELSPLLRDQRGENL